MKLIKMAIIVDYKVNILELSKSRSFYWFYLLENFREVQSIDQTNDRVQ